MDKFVEQELRLMVDDNARARSPFAVAGPVWPRLCKMIDERLQAGQSIDAINDKFSSYPPGDRHYKAYAEHLGCSATTTDWYAAACEANLQKTRPDVAQVAPRPLTWDTVMSLDEIAALVEVEPRLLTDPLVVLDLGSGWGRIGHMLALLNPQLTYVACDIPQPLVVAQTVLPQRVSLPVHPYSECRDLERFDRNVLTPGLWFCGTQHLDKFVDRSIDVFINIASFQELTFQQVSEYFPVIDRVTSGIFYTRQRLVGDEMTRENYPYLKTWEKVYDRGVAFSPYYFEACFRCHGS